MPTPTESAPRLKALAERWAGNTVNEKGSFQTWFLDFCDALGVPKPVPPTDDHRFELPVKVVERHLETLALIGEASVDPAGRYGKAVRVA